MKIYDPKYGSELTSVIIELEKLRVRRLGGTVPPHIFFQIKDIFHILESFGSARIEGNSTTLAEYVEQIINDEIKKTAKESVRETVDESIKEIQNIDRAIDYIEENVNSETKFDRAFISDIHKIIVDGLTLPPEGEGSRYPGELRPINVSIKKSKHDPPDMIKVPDYFEELMDFINQELDTQYHLLVVALSHHRMAWIHPFDNGNGRLVRVFTYALLIKQGFQVKSGRILNPTAIFCMDREKYYEMLAIADTEKEDNVLKWCSYVLKGLHAEITKIDRLLDLSYMTDKILLPMLKYGLSREHITKMEYKILTAIVKSDGMQIKSADLEKILGKTTSLQRSRILKRLKDNKMITPLKENGRIYTVEFSNNYLLRCVIHILKENGFVPKAL